VDLASEDEKEKIMERRRRRLAGEPVPDHYETAFINKSGERIEVEVSLKMTEVDGEPRIITLIRDISELKKSERKLQESYHREREASSYLRRLDELKNDFLSTVSHELRTPLTAIVGFTKTLEGRWTQLEEHSRKELIERLAENADQLDALIGQLLDFSKLERGRIALRIEPKNLKRSVESLVRGMGPILTRHDLDISISDELEVLADEDAMGVIVRNLLTNATKFSPAGSRILVEAEEDGGEVLVTVADEGIGIPVDEVPHIFERFYRVARGNTATRGTGIGLAIAKDFCEAQGGRIWASARNGSAGTSFHFTLVKAPSAPE
ncbi:MAG: PAS domain-containing sensor histidine kinase, partial [Acidimicrobiia bacterium]